MAEVVATIVAAPAAHIGNVYELTGPSSQDMRAVAAEYSDALHRTISSVDVPLPQWRDEDLRRHALPDHVFEHLLTMARLHAVASHPPHTVEALATIEHAELGVVRSVGAECTLVFPSTFKLTGGLDARRPPASPVRISPSTTAAPRSGAGLRMRVPLVT